MRSAIRAGLSKVVFLALCLATLPLAGNGQWLQPSRARHAMVASQHELASKIGCEIMRKGGNAVDAAVAVGLALAVVYPEAGNIGGGGFMLIRGTGGEFHAIDYREMAPKPATRDIYTSTDGELIKGEGSSTLGYRASGVPGTLAGFEMAFRKYGSHRVTWAELVRPARELAAKGYALSFHDTELLKAQEKLSQYEETNRIFLRNGKLYEEGEVLRQPDLAATLSRVEKNGAREFYTGQTARLIAEEMNAHGGLITLDDLKNYQAKERVPLRGSYRGYPIITMSPPSSGGAVALEVLNILEGYDLKILGSNSAAKYHLVAEAMRRGFADRAQYFGDPDFTSIPLSTIIDKSYAARRRSDISPTQASNSRESTFGQIREGTETTHYTIIDPTGMVVTNTYTLNDLYGSKVTIKGTGILMNDEMDDFASRPGKPNLFGLVQGERNKIEPGKRPLSSMTPTIVLRKDGSFWFATGGRGGPRITSAVIQVISNVIDFDMDIQAALDAPRIHHQWLPDELVYEKAGFSPDTLSILSRYGHKFIDKPSNVASTTGVMLDVNGVRLGAIDSRSTGLALGY